MIKKIGFFDEDKFIVSCDGEKIEVIGTSEIAKVIRNMVNDNSGSITELSKRIENFDPVEYIAQSSMNFIPEIVDYSKEKLKEFESKI